MKNKNKPQIKKFLCSCSNEIDIICFEKLQGEENKKIDCTVCLACHVITTGKSKIVDDTGKLEKFMKKYRKNQ